MHCQITLHDPPFPRVWHILAQRDKPPYPLRRMEDDVCPRICSRIWAIEEEGGLLPDSRICGSSLSILVNETEHE